MSAQCSGNLLDNGSLNNTGLWNHLPDWALIGTPDLNDTTLALSPNYNWVQVPEFSTNGGTWVNMCCSEALIQTVNLTPGVQYSINFEYASQGIVHHAVESNIVMGTGSIRLYINDVLVFTTPDDITYFSWQNSCYSFIADSVVNTIKFMGKYDSYMAIDGICLSRALCGSNNSIDLGNDSTLCIGDTLLLESNFSGNDYSWQDGSTEGTFQVTESGTYSFQIDYPTFTLSDSVTIDFINCDTTMNIEDNTSYITHLYPNPSENIIHLKMNKMFQNLDISIRNQLGVNILKQSIQNTNDFSIPIHHLTSGLYYLEIIFDNTHTNTITFIKK